MPRAISRKAPVHHRFQRVGLERRTRDMTLEAEVSNHSYGFGDKQGARLAIRP